MSSAAQVAALSLLVPAHISYIAMSAILSAILRSVSGSGTGAVVPHSAATTVSKVADVEEGDISLAPSASTDATGLSGSPDTPDIIVFKGSPYVYHGVKHQGTPSKGKEPVKMSSWRAEQLRRANPARIMDNTVKPLVTLYGPNSLPYARNPSGVDAQLEVLPRAVVTKDSATLFRERMLERFDASKVATPMAKHRTEPASRHTMIMETPFFPEPTVAAKVIHNVASPAVSIEQERSDSTRSAVLLSQMSKPQVAVAVAESTDPFRPLFEKAVLAKAHASDEAAIIQDTAKYATKASGKADADVDWRKRSDESPQTVMTMDALFEKFSPATAPIEVKSPEATKVTRGLAERKPTNSSPRRPLRNTNVTNKDKSVKPGVEASAANPTAKGKAVTGTPGSSVSMPVRGAQKTVKRTPASKAKSAVADKASDASRSRSIRA